MDAGIYSGTNAQGGNVAEIASKKQERLAFLLLAVLLAPVLAVAIVGGYGFIVWISQIIGGPPSV